jgi:hypothetical protein
VAVVFPVGFGFCHFGFVLVVAMPGLGWTLLLLCLVEKLRAVRGRNCIPLRCCCRRRCGGGEAEGGVGRGGGVVLRWNLL